ncbi:MAG: hypothetical protein ACT4OO_02150 [Nitrospiraceae bacterium]
MLKYGFTIVLGIALIAPLGALSAGFAEMTPAVVVTPSKTGMVTEVTGNDIHIDGYAYRIKEDAEIVDHEGVPLHITSIISNAEVKFYLKNGQINKMIVTLPQ